MKYHFALLLLLMSSAVLANDPALKDSSMAKQKKLAGFYFNLQGNVMPEVPLSRQQLTTLWPDFSKQPYANAPEMRSKSVGLNGVIMEAGATLNSGKRKRLQTQVGISFTTMREIGNRFGTSTSSRIDTLTSSSGGPPLYRDSVKYTWTSIDYFAHYFGIHVNEIYTARISRGFGFVFGAGLKCMYSADPGFSVLNERTNYVAETSDPPHQYNSPPTYQEQTTYSGNSIPTTKSSVVCLANVSAGIDLKIFTLKKSHHSLFLNTAMNSGLDYFKISGFSSISRFYFGLSAGLIFRLG